MNIYRIITHKQAINYKIIPKNISDECLEFLHYFHENIEDIRKELTLLFDTKIKFELIPYENLLSEINRIYLTTQDSNVEENNELNSESKELDTLFQDAINLKCSDIHFESYRNLCRVRYRIDGLLIERQILTNERLKSLTNQIKVRSNLDISEKRLPQDGRMSFEHGGKVIDLRVSTIPSLIGEKVVLRILGNSINNYDLENLGLSSLNKSNLEKALKYPNGMAIVTGPTGSGKTTTLYACLNKINSLQKNILTIEDPIEYTIEGVNQVQLREDIGLDFTLALKSFLRQDPDIIMVGEIRDKSTAEMAVRASLTGHLVLTTLHTNTALGAIERLGDLGVPHFLLKSTLQILIAQRLVRTLCRHCKKRTSISSRVDISSLIFEQENNFEIPEFIFEKSGCEYCYNTGFFGRKAIYEIVPIEDELFEKLNDKSALKVYMKDKGIFTLCESAIEMLIQGETSIDEITELLTLNSY